MQMPPMAMVKPAKVPMAKPAQGSKQMPLPPIARPSQEEIEGLGNQKLSKLSTMAAPAAAPVEDPEVAFIRAVSFRAKQARMEDDSGQEVVDEEAPSPKKKAKMTKKTSTKAVGKVAPVAKAKPSVKSTPMSKPDSPAKAKGTKRTREIEDGDADDSSGDDDGEKEDEEQQEDDFELNNDEDFEPNNDDFQPSDEPTDDSEEGSESEGPARKKRKTAKGAVPSAKSKGKRKAKGPIPKGELWKYSQVLCKECLKKNKECQYATPTTKSCMRCQVMKLKCEKLDPESDVVKRRPQALLETIQGLRSDVDQLVEQNGRLTDAVNDLLRHWGDPNVLTYYGLSTENAVAGPSRRR